MWRSGADNPRITELIHEYHENHKTHADCIRKMTDEELVDAWYYIYYHVIFNSTDSRQGLLEWLKQEVESDG